MDWVVELVKVFNLVFRYLEDDEASLASCARVGQTWFLCATDVLWRNPPVNALSRVTVASRREMYARKIILLDFDKGPYANLHRMYATLEFPKLQHIILHTSLERREDRFPVKQYLTPSLQSFELHGPHAHDGDIVHQVQKHKGLRSLAIKHPGYLCGPVNLGVCLRSHPLLQSLFLSGENIQPLVTAELVEDLLRMPRLRSLEIRSVFPRLPGHEEERRCNIRSLALRIEVGCLYRLLHPRNYIFPRLERLTLVIFSLVNLRLNGVLSPLAYHTTLNHLALRFKSTTSLPLETVLSLRHLRNLRTLSIIGCPLYLQGFTDQHLDSLLKNMPELRHFELRATSCMTCMSLVVMGRNCRKLESLYLHYPMDILALRPLFTDRNLVLFPQVRVVGMGFVEGDPDQRHEQVQSIAADMHRYFPRAMSGPNVCQQDFATEVLEAWKEIIAREDRVIASGEAQE